MTTDFHQLYVEAHEAGDRAVQAAYVRPMVVQQRANPLDDSSQVVHEEFVADGVCGFAWVNVKPGNSRFANWLKKEGLARPDSYAGGVTIWVKGYGQSMQKKEAYARAFAKVLSDAGFRAYADSRLD